MLCKENYVHIAPLNEPGFKSFPTLKREKLTSRSWSYYSRLRNSVKYLVVELASLVEVAIHHF